MRKTGEINHVGEKYKMYDSILEISHSLILKAPFLFLVTKCERKQLRWK